MALKQLLQVLGFEYEELWPTTDAERRQACGARWDRMLRRRSELLVRHSQAITALEQWIEREERRTAELARLQLQTKDLPRTPATAWPEQLQRTRQRLEHARAVLQRRRRRYQERLAQVRHLQAVRSSGHRDGLATDEQR
jgi:hypothetical protein